MRFTSAPESRPSCNRSSRRFSRLARTPLHRLLSVLAQGWSSRLRPRYTARRRSPRSWPLRVGRGRLASGPVIPLGGATPTLTAPVTSHGHRSRHPPRTPLPSPPTDRVVACELVGSVTWWSSLHRASVPSGSPSDRHGTSRRRAAVPAELDVHPIMSERPPRGLARTGACLRRIGARRERGPRRRVAVPGAAVQPSRRGTR